MGTPMPLGCADLIIGYKDEIIKHIASNPMVGVSIGDYVANMLKEVTKKQQL